MSSYADMLWADLRLKNPEGLLEAINEMVRKWSYRTYDDLEEALATEFCIQFNSPLEYDPDQGVSQTIDFYIEESKYRPEDWDYIAPYLEGSIAWAGEVNDFWKDVFRDGKRVSVPGRVVFDDEEEEQTPEIESENDPET